MVVPPNFRRTICYCDDSGSGAGLSEARTRVGFSLGRPDPSQEPRIIRRCQNSPQHSPVTRTDIPGALYLENRDWASSDKLIFLSIIIQPREDTKRMIKYIQNDFSSHPYVSSSSYSQFQVSCVTDLWALPTQLNIIIIIIIILSHHTQIASVVLIT